MALPRLTERALPEAATPQVEVAATWTAYQLPQALSGAAAVTKDGHVLLIGGISAGRQIRSVTSLAPRTGQEQAAGSLPKPVSDAAAAMVHGRLTAFGEGQADRSPERSRPSDRPAPGGRGRRCPRGGRA